MSKAILYIKVGSTAKLQSVYTNAVDATVDAAQTALFTNGGVMPDGTHVQSAIKYDPAFFDVNGNFAGGTITSTYGTPPTGLAPKIIVRNFGAPIAASATALNAAIALTAAAQLGLKPTNILDSVRTVTFTGNAGGIAGNINVYGTSYGVPTTEVVALAGAGTVSTVNAYDPGSVSYDLPIQTHVGTDTVSVGCGAKFGTGIASAYNPIVGVSLGTTLPLSALTAVVLDAGTASKNLATIAGLDGTQLLRVVLVQA